MNVLSHPIPWDFQKQNFIPSHGTGRDGMGWDGIVPSHSELCFTAYRTHSKTTAEQNGKNYGLRPFHAHVKECKVK